MNQHSRRTVIRRAGSVAVGSALLGSTALADDDTARKPSPANAASAKAASPSAGPVVPVQPPAVVPADPALLDIHPQAYVLHQSAVFKLEGDEHSRDLIITSARDVDGKPTHVRVPSSALRVFRIDASVNEFTRDGGFYWEFSGKTGKTQLKLPGPRGQLLNGADVEHGMGELVMIMREGQDTVRCYTMTLDFRC